jgi:NADPH-dependent curcumin reductase CurA
MSRCHWHVACGAISQYDLPEEKRYGVKNLINVSLLRHHHHHHVTH